MAWIHLTLKPVMSHFGGTKFNNKQPREREDLVLIIAFAWQHAPWCSKDNSWEEDGGEKSYLLPCVPDCLCILHRYDTQCPAKHGGTAKSGLAKCKTGWHPRWHMTVFSALSLCVALCKEDDCIYHCPLRRPNLRSKSLDASAQRAF